MRRSPDARTDPRLVHGRGEPIAEVVDRDALDRLASVYRPLPHSYQARRVVAPIGSEMSSSQREAVAFRGRIKDRHAVSVRESRQQPAEERQCGAGLPGIPQRTRGRTDVVGRLSGRISRSRTWVGAVRGSSAASVTCGPTAAMT